MIPILFQIPLSLPERRMCRPHLQQDFENVKDTLRGSSHLPNRWDGTRLVRYFSVSHFDAYCPSLFGPLCRVGSCCLFPLLGGTITRICLLRDGIVTHHHHHVLVFARQHNVGLAPGRFGLAPGRLVEYFFNVAIAAWR